VDALQQLTLLLMMILLCCLCLACCTVLLRVRCKFGRRQRVSEGGANLDVVDRVADNETRVRNLRIFELRAAGGAVG